MWFTPDQARTVAVFTILGFAALALVVLIYSSFALNTCLRSCCPGGGRKRRVAAAAAQDGVGAAAPPAIPFRSLVGAEPYLPLLHSKLFPEPFLAFDAAAVPPRFLPALCARHYHRPAGMDKRESDRGIAHLSLCSRRDVPTAPDAAARAALYGTVRYYPPSSSQQLDGGNNATTAGSGAVVVPNAARLPPQSRMMEVLTPAQLQQPDVAVPLTVAKPLPPGWVAMRDARDGAPYYYHEPTGKVQREDPTAMRDGQRDDEGAGAGVGAP